MWQNYELAISLYDLTTTKLHFTSTNKLQCGLNILPNRFKTITKRIDASWLTLTKETYKQNCKKEFITSPLQLYWFTNVCFVFTEVWFLTFVILMGFFVKRVHYNTFNIVLVFRWLFWLVIGLKWFLFSVMTIWYVCIIIYYYVIIIIMSNKFTIKDNTKQPLKCHDW